MRTCVRDLAGLRAHRFRRALAVRNGPAAYAAATELPKVELADALALTLLLSAETGNLFEKACVRWIGRFSLEVPALPLESAQLALAALSSIRRGSAGAHALAELFSEIGRSDLTEVVERWLRDNRAEGPLGEPLDSAAYGSAKRR